MTFSLPSTACRWQQYPEDLPKLYPLELTFLQEGKPLSEATVTLLPEPPAGKWVAGGMTDASGKIHLKTQGAYPGVVLGNHRIVVSKVELDMSSVKMTEYGPSSRPDSYHLVDPSYSDPGTTSLSIQVEKNTKSAKFDLGGAVRVKIVDSGP